MHADSSRGALLAVLSIEVSACQRCSAWSFESTGLLDQPVFQVTGTFVD